MHQLPAPPPRDCHMARPLKRGQQLYSAFAQLLRCADDDTLQPMVDSHGLSQGQQILRRTPKAANMQASDGGVHAQCLSHG